MYAIRFSDELEKKRKKLKRKNPLLFEQIKSKVFEIAQNPDHYKPLRNDLAGFRRVHFGSYVLVYKIEEENVLFIDIDHHDTIYNKYKFFEKFK